VWSAALLAGALPPLLAYNLSPSPTLINQCLAVALWGGFVAVTAPGFQPVRGRALFTAMGLMMLAVLGSGTLGHLPAALMLSALGLLLAAAVLATAGMSAAQGRNAAPLFTAFAGGLALAGLLSALVALVQVFAPGWTDGDVIAHSGLPGRAVGNLRQPNHLCSLLLWGVIGAIVLQERIRLPRGLVPAAVVLMVFAIELSASRTGAAGLFLLAAWGLFDKRLSRSSRALLLATPLIYGLSYGAMAWYGDWSHQAIGAEARMNAGDAAAPESPNSRPRIWANAWALTLQQPWLGVGFGEFNLAWSLTAFPGRPTAFFDHTHTLPLQLAVELGLPLATLVLALLGLALWQAWRRSGRADVALQPAGRAAFMLVLLTGLHSLFEYPLWYAYFLLPAAFAWGFALGLPAAPTLAANHAVDAAVDPTDPDAAQATTGRPSLPRSAWPLRFAGIALVAGGALAMLDYLTVVAIYAPGVNAGPLDARIARGQRSVLFAHHADYAAATGDDPLPGTALAFRRAPHYLMDTRLMLAWTRHLAASGQLERARWLAQRLAEFRNGDSAAFFAPCKAATATEPAWQCQPPRATHGWREFMDR